METFLGMEAEQPGKVIKLHLDSYIQEVLKDYKKYIEKSLRLKRVPKSPGLVLDRRTVQIFLIRIKKQKTEVLSNRSIDLSSLNFSSLHH